MVDVRCAHDKAEDITSSAQKADRNAAQRTAEKRTTIVIWSEAFLERRFQVLMTSE
jgi:hypothetical protein